MGLRHWTVVLDDPEEVEAVRERVRAAGIATEEREGGGFSCATLGDRGALCPRPEPRGMKKGRSESAALIGVDRGYGTFRELHSSWNTARTIFKAAHLHPPVAPSVSRARNPSSGVL